MYHIFTKLLNLFYHFYCIYNVHKFHVSIVFCHFKISVTDYFLPYLFADPGAPAKAGKGMPIWYNTPQQHRRLPAESS